jgi:hypothetical protein
MQLQKHIYSTTEGRGNSNMVLNLKVKGKHPKERLRPRWEHRLGNMSCRRKGEHDEI